MAAARTSWTAVVAAGLAASVVFAGAVATSATQPGNAAAGKVVFKSKCGGCHTLKAARTSGQVGPNLDRARPSYAVVVARVTNGRGAMPSFRRTLSRAQIQNVAKFVSTTAGR